MIGQKGEVLSKMNNIISAISEFIFVEHKPLKSDLIIVVGGSFPQLAEKAAELYNDGFAPKVMAGGGFSVKSGCFAGVKDKADIYNKNYKTECDFYTDVLLHNGVPECDILREDKSGHTRENAELAAKAAADSGINVKRLIIVCKRFHARRCQIFFQAAFPQAEILVVPADVVGTMNVTKDNWYTNEYGIKRVLGELTKCGNQVNAADIEGMIHA